MRLLLALVLAAAVGGGVYLLVAETSPSQGPAVAPGWRTVAPADEGLDPKLLARAAARVHDEEPSVDALLVARHGRIVLERYFHGYSRDYPFDSYSITKSFTSALVGIALGERRIRSLDQRPRDFLPPTEAAASPTARRITLRQLLTMTSGYPGDDDPRASVGDPPDLVRAIVRRPLVRAPGSGFVYDTASYHLLSAVLTGATHVSAQAYAERHVLGPLGIHLQDEWPRDAQGYTFGGTGLSLPARDLAKLGQLYLQGGRWRGRQLVPRAWVRESTRRQVAASGASGYGYGYGWWTFPGRRAPWYAALGFGGQMLAVVPKLDLLVVVYSEAAGEPTRLGRIVEELTAAVERR